MRNSRLPFFLKFLLPPLVIVGAVVVGAVMINLKREPVEREVEMLHPKVSIVEVHAEEIPLNVWTQGVVHPRVRTTLVSEVSGLVEWVSPALYAGGFFREGELLLRIEATEHEAAVASAESVVAQMEWMHAQELALGEQAARDWERMRAGEATDLVLRKPQMRKAEADLHAARAVLEVARRNLRHTRVLAPYDGRVEAKFVDRGQGVSAKMTQLATIYGIDVAEIRVSLSLRESALIDMPELFWDKSVELVKPSARVFVDLGGQQHCWVGVLDRIEGTVDPFTRLAHAVVVVDQPYVLAEEASLPLKSGLFVKVEIEGKRLERGFRIPRSALRSGDTVFLLNGENRLEIRAVEVVKSGENEVVVSSGLEEGDRVITTPMLALSPGMELVPIEESGREITPQIGTE